MFGAGDKAQWVECLHSMRRPCVCSSALHKTGRMVRACDPSSELEVGESGSSGHPQLRGASRRRKERGGGGNTATIYYYCDRLKMQAYTLKCPGCVAFDLVGSPSFDG